MPQESSLSVLDVGVGSGLSLPHYGAAHRVTGIDLSSAMLARAERKTKRCTAQISLQEMDASTLKFAPASFDAVLMFYALSVFPAPAAAIAEATRVLKPGGSLIVVNHSYAPKGVIRAMERAVAPLATLLGFRSDLGIEDLLKPVPALSIHETKRANAFAYWTVIHCTKNREEAQ